MPRTYVSRAQNGTTPPLDTHTTLQHKLFPANSKDLIDSHSTRPSPGRETRQKTFSSSSLPTARSSSSFNLSLCSSQDSVHQRERARVSLVTDTMSASVTANATAALRNASSQPTTRAAVPVTSHIQRHTRRLVRGREAIGRALTGRGRSSSVNLIQVRAAVGGSDAPWASRPPARCVHINFLRQMGCGGGYRRCLCSGRGMDII